MALRIQTIGLSCAIVLFVIGCSPVRKPAETQPNAASEKEHTALKLAETTSIESAEAIEESENSVQQTELSDDPSEKDAELDGDRADERSKHWKAKDKPWTSTEVLSISRPLDFDELASGIREKYELEALNDPRLELEELLRLFEAGDSSVVFDLGLFLAYGEDVIFDPARAIEFFEEAALNGESRALSELGRMHLVGLGIAPDATRAENYFRQAMEQGDPEGAFLLGASNRLELLENSDKEMGMEYLETAAEFGHDAAAIALLFVSSEIDGYSQLSDAEKKEARELARERIASYSKMEQWLLDAAETGEVNSINALARYYSSLNQKDKALSAYETAAELGSFAALSKLIDLRLLDLRDAGFRDSMKELVSIHLENGGPKLAQMKFKMALLESFTAKNAESRARVQELLEDAKSLWYDKSFVAMSLIESGEPPLKAIVMAQKMSDEDAYLRRVQIRRESNAESGEWGSPDVPQVIRTAAPVYPSELKAEALSGTVRVQFFVDRGGRVYGVEAIESTHPAFSKSAVEAVSNFVFSAPPNMKGAAVKFQISLEFKP